MNREEIEKDLVIYCKENNLDYKALLKMPYGIYGEKENKLEFYYYEEQEDSSGLLDDKPMPILLKIEKRGKEVLFEQTENTLKYLSK